MEIFTLTEEWKISLIKETVIDMMKQNLGLCAFSQAPSSG